MLGGKVLHRAQYDLPRPSTRNSPGKKGGEKKRNGFLARAVKKLFYGVIFFFHPRPTPQRIGHTATYKRAGSIKCRGQEPSSNDGNIRAVSCWINIVLTVEKRTATGVRFPTWLNILALQMFFSSGVVTYSNVHAAQSQYRNEFIRRRFADLQTESSILENLPPLFGFASAGIFSF